MFTKFLLGKLKGRDHLEDLSVDGRVKLGLRELGWDGLDCFHVAQGQGPVADSCEHINEPSGSVRSMEFFGIIEWLLAFQEGFCCSIDLVSYLKCGICVGLCCIFCALKDFIIIRCNLKASLMIKSSRLV
jgi:hypothetical protein